MNTTQLNQAFVKVPQRKRPKVQHPAVTKSKTVFSTVSTTNEPHTKLKRPLKVPSGPKKEQTSTENKNTSYMSIYL